MIPLGLINHGRDFDEFKGKDCGFMADWLKTKGLHKLFPHYLVNKPLQAAGMSADNVRG